MKKGVEEFSGTVRLGDIVMITPEVRERFGLLLDWEKKNRTPEQDQEIKEERKEKERRRKRREENRWRGRL